MSLRAALVFAVLCLVPFSPVSAQNIGIVQNDIVLLDPERLFEETLFGQMIARRVQEERNQLIALNRRLEAELEAEEQALTEIRDTTSPEEFRDLADAFDDKVQRIRRDSERRVRELERSRDRAPRDFLSQVEPVLIDLMRDTGAVVVLDQRSVLFSADVVDVTDVAIARIDAVLGRGQGGAQQETPGNTQDDPPDLPAPEDTPSDD